MRFAHGSTYETVVIHIGSTYTDLFLNIHSISTRPLFSKKKCFFFLKVVQKKFRRTLITRLMHIV